MGVYSVNSLNESSMVDSVEVEDIYVEDFMEAALINVYENTCNMNAIMQSIGIAELAVYESTGEEVVYEASNGTGIIAKFKAQILKIWQKIKSLFDKFLAKMNSFGKDDAKFVNKFKKQILQGSTKGLEIKGFDYSIDALTASGVWSKIKPSEGDYSGKSDSEISDSLRGKALGKSELSSSEFQEELFMAFRNGEDRADTISENKINKGELIQFLSGTAAELKSIKKDYSDTEKIVKELLKGLDKKEAELAKIKGQSSDEINKNSTKLADVSRYSRTLTSGLNVLQIVDGARMKAFNDKRKQCKSICVKIVGRKDPKNESVDFGESYNENSFESILGGVKLI